MNPVFGGLNEALRLIGLGALTQQWLTNPTLVMYSLICVFSWSYIGVSMMLFHAGISQIDPELYEMATLEGANFFQTLWMVTLPMLRPVMTVVVTLTVISSLKAFDLVLLMTKGGPYKMSNVLGYFMYTEAFHKYRFGYGAAISVIILLLSSVFAAVYLRNIAKGALHAE
jgi:multiple sugar transport system permease protein/raffinose/stachyose/melibiose transport system permease protein